MTRATTHAMHLLTLAALTLGQVACDGANAGQPGSPDQREGTDIGPGDSISPAAPWTFTEESAVGQSGVALRLEKASGDLLTFKVVGRGLGTLQGLALRLSYPAGRVKVVQSEAGQGWSGSGGNLVARFAARPEGELWAGLGLVGSQGVNAAQELELAMLQLKVTGTAPVKLGFRPYRNLALDANGKRIKTSWLGGELARK